jgi:alanine-glyoxylate transaminase/serine-glyoxylate transaminase/serine-pyruvate transaminase
MGGGLGPLKGRIWRVGLMGAGATRQAVMYFLAALRSVLVSLGLRAVGDPLAAVTS